jgi:hypothetical protein
LLTQQRSEVFLRFQISRIQFQNTLTTASWAQLKAVGVPCELVIKKGAGHTWNLGEDGPQVADWFDRHLAKPKLEKR